MLLIEENFTTTGSGEPEVGYEILQTGNAVSIPISIGILDVIEFHLIITHVMEQEDIDFYRV